MNHANIRYFIRTLGFVFAAVICLSFAPASAAAEGDVKLSVTPPLEEVAPNGDPVTFTLTVKDEKGQPVPNARVTFSLTSPSKHWLFSTDFPIVEGTKLLEGSGLARDGTWTFQYIPPIRGTYVVDVRVEPTSQSPSFEPFSRRLSFTVHEHPAKVRNAVLLFASIAVFGGCVGWLIGRSRYAGLRLNTAAAALLLIVSVAPLEVWAHNHGDHDHSKLPSVIHTGNDKLDVKLSLSPNHAAVGKPVSFEGIVTNKKTGKPVDMSDVSVKVLHLEHQAEVLKTSFGTTNGQFAWKQQFYDGTKHKVTLEILPGEGREKPLTVTIPVDVEAIQPPAEVAVKTMTLLLGTALVTMVAGYLLAGRRATYESV